jgi:hypothetical protein
MDDVIRFRSWPEAYREVAAVVIGGIDHAYAADELITDRETAA